MIGMPPIEPSSRSSALSNGPGDDTVISVIGLGYVGLPLAAAFGARFETRGFDSHARRVAELQAGRETTGAVDAKELRNAKRLTFTSRLDELKGSDVFAIAVPTPIDADKRPNLDALECASRMVGQVIEPGNVVILESTVYPGTTEEICAPLIAAESGLAFNRDFFAGYSPERINPGDRQRRLQDVVKVTAGSTPETAAFVDALYASIVPAGTHRAADIRTAEAAKVIENVQRDLNIALVNELAMIFHRLELDTEAVLQAAGSKWNFQRFQPGLVGGHCIGVDPYYLMFKAQQAGHAPQLVQAGRRINDAMPSYVAERVVALMAQANIGVANSRILVLGFAFKENCPDVRNTKVVDLVAALEAHGAQLDVFDPWVCEAEGVNLIRDPQRAAYDAVIVAVAHDQFRALGAEGIRAFGKPRHVVFDVKHLLPAGDADGRL